MAHNEPPHQDLRCLQIQLFSSLAVKELKRQTRLQQKTFINTLSLFSEKIRIDISCESSAAKQRIHMKHQNYFLRKIKAEKTKVSSAAIFVWRFKGYCSLGDLHLREIS